MSVHARKRKNRTVYYVCTSWEGGQHWELVGTVKREAETLDGKRRREVREGTFEPGRITDRVSVLGYAKGWLSQRINNSADNDRMLLERHVLTVDWFATLALGDVRPKHFVKLIAELEAKRSDRTGKRLSAKTVSLILGLLRVMFRDAVIGETLTASPYLVARGKLTRGGVKRQPYTERETLALLAQGRAWDAVALLGGLRCGEICGLRWGDWDQATEPLQALVVERQYDGQPLKTKRPRVVPVHPLLSERLAEHRRQWEIIQCREPLPGDLMFPGQGGTALTKSAAYKAWLKVCRAAGVGNRSVHSTRHTFISLARRGGADKAVLELVTHNPKGEIIDRYTTRDWAELCGVVLALPVNGLLDAEKNGSGIDGSSSWTRTTVTPGNGESFYKPGKPGRPPKRRETPGRVVTAARVDASQESEEAAWRAALAEHSELVWLAGKWVH